jgi:hypothetical protein
MSLDEILTKIQVLWGSILSKGYSYHQLRTSDEYQEVLSLEKKISVMHQKVFTTEEEF